MTYLHAVSKDHFTKKDDISRGNALSKCCSPDPNNFKTVFEFSVSLLVREIYIIFNFRFEDLDWDPDCFHNDSSNKDL